MPPYTPHDLRRLLAAHADDIESIVRRCTDDAMDRDDLRQEIAIAIWRAMPRFLGRSGERTYLMRIAQNRATTFRLRLARNRALFHPLDFDPPVPERHSGEHDIEALRTLIAAAAAELSVVQHEALAFAAEGYTPRQIAARTGRSAGAVRVALHRARDVMRRWLNSANARLR